MIAILAFGYIKPDIESLAVKKETLAIKTAQSMNVSNVVEHINTLNRELETASDAESFMYRYLPKSATQEQMIDTFNFLATQSGVAIVEIALHQPIKNDVSPKPLPDASPDALSTHSTNVMLTPSVQPVSVENVVLTGTIAGSYDNIKIFLDRLTHIERFQKMRFFTLESLSAKSTETQQPLSQSLRTTIEVEYGYLPSASVASALMLPVFAQSSFDMSPVQTFRSQITNPIPVLEKGIAGKPNPFE